MNDGVNKQPVESLQSKQTFSLRGAHLCQSEYSGKKGQAMKTVCVLILFEYEVRYQEFVHASTIFVNLN